MRFADAGSSFCKTFSPGDTAVILEPTRQMARQNRRFQFGTGHTARRLSDRFENDLISLARGGLALLDVAEFTVLDLGSRDAKVVSFKDRRPVRLDWSVGCAAATGATVEMLGHFYQVDFATVPVDDRWTAVTCGTYAVERVMDAVSRGEDVLQAIGRFLHGLARNVVDFAGRPSQLYLSGGFTLNPAFLCALQRYTEVICLGRTVPLCGLWAFAQEADASLGPIPDALRNSVCRMRVDT